MIPLGIDLAPADADQAQQSVADRVQPDHDRVEREPERFDDRRHVEHRVRRPLEGESLRHHLANHDVEIGEDGDGNDAGQGVGRHPPQFLEHVEVRRNPDREGMLAVHPESEACYRDPDLSRGDVSILQLRVLEDPLDALREPASLSGLMLDAGPRRSHDRKLRCHEKPVGQHQQQHDGDRNRRLRSSRPPRPRLMPPVLRSPTPVRDLRRVPPEARTRR